MKTETYTPRVGSKVELATLQLSDGPMSAAELAAAIGMAKCDLSATLAAAIEHGVIRRVKDETGLHHYALGGQVLDGRFTDAGGRVVPDAPMVRKVDEPSVKASAEALAAANMFSGRIPTFPTNPLTTKPKEKMQRTSRVLVKRETATVATEPPAPQEEKLVAGLFNTGELMISAGDQTLRLSQKHTRELFEYLDKIADMLQGTGAGHTMSVTGHLTAAPGTISSFV